MATSEMKFTPSKSLSPPLSSPAAHSQQQLRQLKQQIANQQNVINSQSDAQLRRDIGHEEMSRSRVETPSPVLLTMVAPGGSSSSRSSTPTIGSNSLPPMTASQRLSNKTTHLCSVCGDRAFYVFYGALACDSCRTFFRRQVLQSKVLACHFKNACDIQLNTRKDCAKCRLDKCLRVGMKQNLVAVNEGDGSGSHSKGRSKASSSAGSSAGTTVAATLAQERVQSSNIRNNNNSVRNVRSPPGVTLVSSSSSSPEEHVEIRASPPAVAHRPHQSHIAILPQPPTVSTKRGNSSTSNCNLSESSPRVPLTRAQEEEVSPVGDMSSGDVRAVDTNFIHPKLRHIREYGVVSTRVTLPRSTYSVTRGRGRVVTIECNEKERYRLSEITEASKSLQEPVNEDLLMEEKPFQSFFGQLLSIATHKMAEATCSLEAFTRLLPDSRVLLLQGAMPEMLFLWSMTALNWEEKKWTLPCFKSRLDSKPPTVQVGVLKLAKEGEHMYNKYVELVEAFDVDWRRDHFLLLLVCVICLFSDRDGVTEITAIRFERRFYLSILKRYLEGVYGDGQLEEASAAYESLTSQLEEISVLRKIYETTQVDLDNMDSLVEPTHSLVIG